MPEHCLHNVSCEIVAVLPTWQPVAVRGGARVERECEGCRVVFAALVRRVRAGRARFCSRSCARRAAILDLNAVQPPVGSANRAWKGGVSRDHYRYTRRFRAKFPEKLSSQRAVRLALESGALVRPSECSSCRATCKPDAHHDDYAQPLNVRWLCKRCHRAHHIEERRREGCVSGWLSTHQSSTNAAADAIARFGTEGPDVPKIGTRR